MNWVTYDAEVFAHDFIVIFKDRATGEYAVFHNDNLGVKEYINDESIYCGFNSKSYDQYIIKAICSGFCPEEVKQVNDWIIGGGQGWQCPLLNGCYFRFNNVDIMDDMQMGLSLKAIEGHLGLSIEETEVDFNLDRVLTPEEIALTIKYCKHDVDCTELNEYFSNSTGYHTYCHKIENGIQQQVVRCFHYCVQHIGSSHLRSQIAKQCEEDCKAYDTGRNPT